MTLDATQLDDAQVIYNVSMTTGLPQRAAVVTAVRYAAAQLGKPYIWGGTGPHGYDCSGLVMMAYQAAGITIPRTTNLQAGTGTPVYSLPGLKPGDLGKIRPLSRDFSRACGGDSPGRRWPRALLSVACVSFPDSEGTEAGQQ